ncbi:MAG: phosphoesterase [Gemmataceae bacterium]
MSERVLVVPAARLHAAGAFDGFSPDVGRYLPALLDPAHLRFLPRAEAEDDPAYKQLIPYLVLRHGGRLFHYTRAGGGEARLRARRSVGLGGHINPVDDAGGDVYRAGMLRELREEAEVGDYTETCVGVINDDRTPVGRVHVGIVHVLELAEPAVRLLEPGLVAGGWAAAAELRAEEEAFETWSRFLIEVMGGTG